ncbi:hypothetical protein E2C01_021884 [Portunus trituberculatus]|uniref:Uncharacterized protein n=1 Tax=Portunus trituberculatus TaxID=210409 RepID=A0A5B7E660_PORTR|nr:hypothetical protein [Portunus trituberculatus]
MGKEEEEEVEGEQDDDHEEEEPAANHRCVFTSCDLNKGADLFWSLLTNTTTTTITTLQSLIYKTLTKVRVAFNYMGKSMMKKEHNHYDKT